MKNPTPPAPTSFAFAPLNRSDRRRILKRFLVLKTTSLIRLERRVRAKLAAGWRIDGPILSITDYVGRRSRDFWSQGLCFPAAAT